MRAMSTSGIHEWRTSLYGGYTRVWYNQTATDIAAEHLPTPNFTSLPCVWAAGRRRQYGRR